MAIWKFKNCKNFKNYKNFESVVEAWNFFPFGNFHCRFRIWAQNWQKFFSLTRERLFVHFWRFREDLFDHSQAPAKYRGRHFWQESRKKIFNIYGQVGAQGLHCKIFVSSEVIFGFFFRWELLLEKNYVSATPLNFS